MMYSSFRVFVCDVAATEISVRSQPSRSPPYRVCACSESRSPEMCTLRRESMWGSSWKRPPATATAPSKERPTSRVTPRFAFKISHYSGIL